MANTSRCKIKHKLYLAMCFSFVKSIKGQRNWWFLRFLILLSKFLGLERDCLLSCWGKQKWKLFPLSLSSNTWEFIGSSARIAKEKEKRLSSLYLGKFFSCRYNQWGQVSFEAIKKDSWKRKKLFRINPLKKCEKQLFSFGDSFPSLQSLLFLTQKTIQHACSSSLAHPDAAKQSLPDTCSILMGPRSWAGM